jgi:hypothetical protein
MAKVKNNIFLENLTGTIGKKMNIYNLNGQTIVRKAKKKKPFVATPKQIRAQHKFQDATDYASKAIQDPELKAAYAAIAPPGLNAYNMALKDAYNPPVIERIDIDNYRGKVGDTVIIRATDIFRVYQVTVEICTMEGVVLEKGNAQLGRNGKDWIYTALIEQVGLRGGKVIAMAEDVPGNKTHSEVIF